MLSSDDNSGLFTFMVGLIIIVFAGIALSMMVDRKFSFSKRVSSLAGEIKAAGEEIDQLKDHYQESSRKLAELEPKLRTLASTRESLRSQLSEADSRNASLTASRDSLRKSIPTLSDGFSQYRKKYRESTWAAAVGQSLGNLRIRGGREYHQAVIVRVTDVGLEIRHEHGIARIQAPDLDQAFQDRFQWNDEERRARLGEEKAAHDAVDTLKLNVGPQETRLPKTDRTEDDSSGNVPDLKKLEALRSKVTAWKSKVSQLDSERRQALSSSSYGSQSSIPGSLETWQAKASRLGNELAKARSELAASKAALSLISPNDPLLRPEIRR